MDNIEERASDKSPDALSADERGGKRAVGYKWRGRY